MILWIAKPSSVVSSQRLVLVVLRELFTSTDEFHEHSDADEVLHDYEGNLRTTYRNVMDDDF